jgi:hypothetical protein
MKPRYLLTRNLLQRIMHTSGNLHMRGIQVAMKGNVLIEYGDQEAQNKRERERDLEKAKKVAEKISRVSKIKLILEGTVGCL